MQTFSSLFLLIQITAVLHCQPLADAFLLSTNKLKLRSLVANKPWKVTKFKKTDHALGLNVNGDLFSDDDAFDVEAARRRLELLVRSSRGGEQNGKIGDNQRSVKPLVEGPSRASEETLASLLERFSPAPDMSDFVDIPPPPPMTAIERERKEAEAKLLECLKDGDDVLTDLWDLWFEERGPEAASKLREADDLTGNGPQGWRHAETILRELVDQYGIYWSEPINRLATLYYMQGNLNASERMCHIVLAVKPWHFGALSGLVMVYAAKHNSEKARVWAAHRLPTFAPIGPNRRREQWVTNAVKQALEKIAKAEKELKESFGQEDEHVQNIKLSMQKIKVEEDDCWQ